MCKLPCRILKLLQLFGIQRIGRNNVPFEQVGKRRTCRLTFPGFERQHQEAFVVKVGALVKETLTGRLQEAGVVRIKISTIIGAGEPVLFMEYGIYRKYLDGL